MRLDKPEHVTMRETTPCERPKTTQPSQVALPIDLHKLAGASPKPESQQQRKPDHGAAPAVKPAGAEAPSGPPPAPPAGQVSSPGAVPEAEKEEFIDTAQVDLAEERAAEIEKKLWIAQIWKGVEQQNLENPPALALAMAVHEIELENVKPVSWLVPEWIALGALANIVGEPGVGKSKVVIDIAAAVTTGRPIGDRGPTLLGDVLMVLSEDDPYSVVAPRLQQQGADLARVRFHRLGAESNCQQTLDLLTDRRLLAKRLDQLPNVRLVVVDSLDLFLGVRDPARVRVGLSRLLQLFESRGIALVAVTPLRNAENKSASDLLGELPFSSLSAGIWQVQPDYRHPHRRQVVAVKQKLADAGDMEFELNPSGKVIWRATSAARSAGKRGSLVQQAARQLVAELETGPKASTYMYEYMEAAGYSHATTRRACKKLGVRAMRDGYAWQWSLDE
jgi:putative DNA primase/helicase